MKPAALLTIAGYDPSNGAGMTADLQVFAAHGCFGMSAITALTVQSTQELLQVQPVDARLLEETLKCVAADIVPAGIKIGMLPDRAAVEAVASFLLKFSGQHANVPIVLDPVLGSSSGVAFLHAEGIDAMRSTLLHRVSWITPNWKELGALTERSVDSFDQASIAMNALGQEFRNLKIVATGGDCGVPDDLLRTPDGTLQSIGGLRVDTTSTHGTGCAFSSALLCQLVSGEAPLAAVRAAKTYVEGALRHAPGIGHGHGPMGLLWPLLVRSNNP